MRRIQFSTLFLAAAAMLAFGSATAQAQPGRGGGSWFGGGGGESMGLLMREDVRKELEIVQEQQDQLRAAGEEMRREMREMFSGLRDLSEEERRERFAEMRESMREKTKQLEGKVNDILLPHQRDRLRQLQSQMRMRYSGTSASLSSGRLAEQLGVTDEQKEKLQKVQEEVQKELNEKIRIAREEAREKILGVLTAEQREKFKTMTGDAFEFDRRQGDSRRGGFRGRRPGGGDSRDST